MLTTTTLTTEFKNKGSTRTQLQQVLDYIHTHLDRDLSLAKLAETLNLSISEYHARFYDFISIVLIPVFLVIVFRVFKRDEAPEPVSQSDRKGGQ